MHKITKLNQNILRKIGLNCPQLKEIIDIDIKNIEEYGHEYAFGEDNTQEIYINDEKYIVKEDVLSMYLELIERNECKNLTVCNSTINEIYNCYRKILGNKRLFDVAMMRYEFKNTYEQHQNGKVFKAMNYENSVVATILFTLYH